MSQIVVCHNKACRLRVPIHHAKNRNGQLFCSDKCVNGCNPPSNDKKDGQEKTTIAQAYWDILLKQKPRPHPNVEIPLMEFGDWT